MAEGVPRQHAAARRALHEALLQQVRLDDLFDDVALGAADYGPELRRLIKDKTQRNAEALPQRPGDQTRTRRRADQSEGREAVANRSRSGSLTDDQIDLIILHRRVEILLCRRRQTVD